MSWMRSGVRSMGTSPGTPARAFAPAPFGRGTSFIPHFAQVALGASEMTSGCIGHQKEPESVAVEVAVGVTFEVGAVGFPVVAPPSWIGARSIPHIGQAPGMSVMTDGCIGQRYWTTAWVVRGAASK